MPIPCEKDVYDAPVRLVAQKYKVRLGIDPALLPPPRPPLAAPGGNPPLSVGNLHIMSQPCSIYGGKALQIKLDLCIPRKEIVRSHSVPISTFMCL
jgi:hypothetical protein